MPESFLAIDTGLKSIANVPITATLDAWGAFILKITELSGWISGETSLVLFCAPTQTDKVSKQKVKPVLYIKSDFFNHGL